MFYCTVQALLAWSSTCFWWAWPGAWLVLMTTHATCAAVTSLFPDPRSPAAPFICKLYHVTTTAASHVCHGLHVTQCWAILQSNFCANQKPSTNDLINSSQTVCSILCVYFYSVQCFTVPIVTHYYTIRDKVCTCTPSRPNMQWFHLSFE